MWIGRLNCYRLIQMTQCLNSMRFRAPIVPIKCQENAKAKCVYSIKYGLDSVESDRATFKDLRKQVKALIYRCRSDYLDNIEEKIDKNPKEVLL